ncbi:MAG: AAA family ATPase [Candidatus Binatia bacterium]
MPFSVTESGHKPLPLDALSRPTTDVQATGVLHYNEGRRQLTTMFCDLVGSTALSTRLELEEFREVIQAYQDLCSQIVSRFEGHVARYLGDGVLVYFGFPRALEGDADRAVRAGFEILAALPQLNMRLQESIGELRGRSLRVRIGIATGLVVVGTVQTEGRRDPVEVVGEPLPIAARLQEIAEPNSMLVCATTFHLIQGQYSCHALGTPALKDVFTPIAVYRVLEENEAQTELEIAAAHGLSPLVGREQEVALLLQRWQQAKTGNGQVVLLSGEAGIGKSRLVQALREHTKGEVQTWLECHCSLYHQHSALHPAVDLLRRGLRLRRADPPDEKLAKLERAVARYGLPPAEVVPLFAAWLGLPLPSARYAPLQLTAHQQRQRVLDGLRIWLAKAAEQGPVIGVVEDVQWADPSTLESLALFMEQVPLAPILIVVTFRPDFPVPWRFASYITHLPVGRLEKPAVEGLVTQIAGDSPLPPQVLQQLVQKSDGVPLFAEELTKMVIESRRPDNGIEKLPSAFSIPTTLYDVLMTRLDRLGVAKEVAQLGATIGREFPYELLRAISQEKEKELQPSLAALVEAELLYQRGVPPQATYFFKHTLIQEAAYQSLLRRRQQQYHRSIAQVLESRTPEDGVVPPEVIAHHYTAARLPEQAIPHWQRAGTQANERSAHVEAIHHFRQGLLVLNDLPHSHERERRELDLQIALGGPLIATQGYGASEVEQCYARALALSEQLGETPRLLRALLGLEAYYFIRGQLRTAQHLGERCLALASHGQHGQLLQGHWALGQALFHLGNFAGARHHVECGMALYSPQLHQPRALQDPGVMCLAYAALTQWCIGNPDTALRQSRELLSLARALSHRFSLAFALNIAATVHLLRSEFAEATSLATEAVVLCVESGFPVWEAYGRVLLGWLGVQQGHGTETLNALRNAIAAWEQTGARVARTSFLALLGQAYAKLGYREAAMHAVEEALATVAETDERYCEAELHRLKGELLLAQEVKKQKSEILDPKSQILNPNPQGEAEACFTKALNGARRQGARTFELRAALSLTALWKRQGKHEPARQLVAEVYRHFTEGFTTPDLRRARTLLRQLGVEGDSHE